MRRSSLLTVAVLGALICLIGGTGLFAALTDTARSGTNSVDSAALAASADIQIARATIPGTTPPNFTCGALSEELASGFFTASDITVGYSSTTAYFCVKNVGSQPVTLTALATDLVDVDEACTGDEAAFDATCGDNKAGELSGVLGISYQNIGSCINNAGGGSPQLLYLRDNATTPAALGTLAVGQTLCYSVAIAYPVNTSADDVQRAQSDAVTWRITFTAQS
jgi:hypothetical protein